MRGGHGIRFALVWALGCLAAACSPYLERETPGAFFDVQLTGPAPDTLCQELAEALASRMNFELKWHGPLERADQCGALLNEATGATLREIWITMDAPRGQLHVELRELGPSGPEKPSRQTEQLGKQLEQRIHERFPAARVTRGKRFSGLLAP
ncbi:MAG TPA: hypothetical protein VH111_09715 [Steroidobacteraceae bacterium]|nr:hypothetical protein [Steroidobacteraceae bacterium]